MAKKHKHNVAKSRYLEAREQQSLHLSEFSQGKPYEFSLNVLENKLLDQTAKKQQRRFFRRKSTGGTHSITQDSLLNAASEGFDASSAPLLLAGGDSENVRAHNKRAVSFAQKSFSDASGILDDASYDEINRRKKQRRAHRFIVALALMFVVIIAAFGGNYVYQGYQNQRSNVDLLQTSLNYLEKSDTTLVEMDTFFQTAFNDETLPTAQSLKEKIPHAKESLAQARDYAQRADNGLSTSDITSSGQDREAAECALASVAARETMFAIGTQRIDEDIAAKQAMDALKAAQGRITEANTLLAQSSKVIANTTNESVEKSTEYTTSARALFTSAKEQVQKAQDYYRRADVSVLSSYVDKRIEATDAALSSNAAILIQDKKTAETYNDAYNKADIEAAALAQQLPVDFAQPVVDAYQAAVQSLTEQYNAARGDVGRNDANLRSYLDKETSA